MQTKPWTTHPDATKLIEDCLAAGLSRSPWLRQFQEQLIAQTGTRLLDWIDRISIPMDRAGLERLGFRIGSEVGDAIAMRHSAAQLPWVIPSEGEARTSSTPDMIAIRTASILDFATAQRLDHRNRLHGKPLAGLRRILVEEFEGGEVWAVERHGNWHWKQSESLAQGSVDQLSMAERFRMRRRDQLDIEDGFNELNGLVTEAIDLVGVHRAADLFFTAERDYWQARNWAGQLQKIRQDRLGLGWANHDHHTYRSSRTAFRPLIQLLERLGFECRERFYAGLEAGWGAQVMEQPAAGLVVFADVDLSEDEIVKDFAHQPLEMRNELGTVGLWCALHGEAILEAGLHHLECQFDFENARQQLAEVGAPSMLPFTDLPHLRQSFTVGEVWPVRHERINIAMAAGWITREQADRFLKEGAIGSHLEILQRNAGFKGFNPKGISDIILDTDPRKPATRLALDH